MPVEAPAPQVLPRAPTPDLAPLLAAAASGDAGAFEALYRRFSPVVHGIAIARVGASDAEDVVQEVFLSVHRRLATLRDPAAFPGWLASVARHEALDRLRRRARAPAPAPLPDLAAPRDREGDAGLRERVLARLQALPEAFRETLVWRLVEGLDGPEIASRTGMSPGSVRVNLFRGMALLREALSEEGWR